MKVRELKKCLDLIKDDQIEVKMIVGYEKCRIGELDCVVKGTPKLSKMEDGRSVAVDEYEKSTLFLVGDVYGNDAGQSVKNSIMTIARLNGEALIVSDENKEEFEQYLKLKQKFEKQ